MTIDDDGPVPEAMVRQKVRSTRSMDVDIPLGGWLHHYVLLFNPQKWTWTSSVPIEGCRKDRIRPDDPLRAAALIVHCRVNAPPAPPSR